MGSFSALQVPLPAHDIHIIHSTFQWTFQSLRAESHCGPVLQTGPPIDGLPGSQQSDLCTGHLHCLLFIEEQNEWCTKGLKKFVFDFDSCKRIKILAGFIFPHSYLISWLNLARGPPAAHTRVQVKTVQFQWPFSLHQLTRISKSLVSILTMQAKVKDTFSAQSCSSRVLTASELQGKLGTTKSWRAALGTRLTQEILNLGMHLEMHMENSGNLWRHLLEPPKSWFSFLQCIFLMLLCWTTGMV